MVRVSPAEGLGEAPDVRVNTPCFSRRCQYVACPGRYQSIPQLHRTRETEVPPDRVLRRVRQHFVDLGEELLGFLVIVIVIGLGLGLGKNAMVEESGGETEITVADEFARFLYGGGDAA